MKHLVSSLLLLTTLLLPVQCAPDARSILEVRVSSNDPIIAAPEQYLQLRVFVDGRVEFEDQQKGESKLTFRQTTLSSSDVRSLMQFLDGSNVRGLEREYPPASPTIDHRRIVQITINHADGSQAIKIPNYSVTLGKDRGIYSQGLINLMCRIERIRGNTTLQLTPNTWCALWSR